MDTKGLERNIKKIIATGSGYGPEFLPTLKQTKAVLKKINRGRKTSDNYFILGELCLKLEDFGLAREAFKTGYQHDPNHVNCGTYYALLLEQLEQPEEALSVYIELNKIDPTNINIVERMLLIFYARNDTKQVLTICQYFIQKELKYHIIYRYIAQVFSDIGNHSRAVDYMETAIVLNEVNNQEYINILIEFYFKNNDFEKITKLKDNIFTNEYSKLHIKLIFAVSLAELGKISEARKQFCSLYIQENDRLSVLSQIALFHFNFENNLAKSNFINQYILNRDPLNVVALTNISMHESKAFALESYRKAYQQKAYQQHHENPIIRMNYGYELIHSGQFELGYKLYESRIITYMPFLSGRLSYPEKLENNYIFIWREQGIADEIMNSWFFQFLSQSNIKHTIQIDERLLPLMNRSFPELTFTGLSNVDILAYEDLEKYDHEIALVSLAKYYTDKILKTQNAIEQGINQKPYLLTNQSRTEYWKGKLSKLTTRKTVGVCWRSGKQGKGRHGFLTAQMTADLFSDLDCCIVNLQYSYTAEEAELLSSVLGDRFINFQEIDLKNDQDDLASLINALDFVFSATTAVYALAGAIGKKTYTFVYQRKNDDYIVFDKPYNMAFPSVEYWGENGKFPKYSLGYIKSHLEKVL